VRLPRGEKRNSHHPRTHKTRIERQSGELPPVLERNIDAIVKHREEAESARSRQERIADWITWFSGNLPFVYFHAVWFTLWIVANLGLFGLPPFDPFPYGLLTMIVSLEAIFLSTFVLVSQNRQALLADRRADLDLQTNLLAEHEITRVLAMLDAICKQLDVKKPHDSELQSLVEDVEPEKLLSKLESAEPKPQGTKTSSARDAEPAK